MSIKWCVGGPLKGEQQENSDLIVHEGPGIGIIKAYNGLVYARWLRSRALHRSIMI